MQYKQLSNLYSNTLEKIFSDKDELEKFLKFSAYTYKHKYEDAVLIYKQSPNSRLITDMNKWREGTGRYISNGARVIHVFDESFRVKRYFDIKDTYIAFEHPNNNPKLWEVDEDIRQDFEKKFQDIDGMIKEKIYNLQISESEVSKIFEHSQLSSMSIDTQFEAMEDFIYKTSSFVVNYRCGKDIKLEQPKALKFLKHSQNYIMLGNLSRTISKEVLGEIEQVVHDIQKERVNHGIQLRGHESGRGERTEISTNRDRLGTDVRGAGNGVNEVRSHDSELHDGTPRSKEEFINNDGRMGERSSGASSTSRRDVRDTNADIRRKEPDTEHRGLPSESTTQNNDTQPGRQNGTGSTDIQNTIETKNQELSNTDNSFFIPKNDVDQLSLTDFNIDDPDVDEPSSEESGVNSEVNLKLTNEPKIKNDIERKNYKYQSTDNIGIGGVRVKLEQNLKAIKTLKKIEVENRLATVEEQSILAQYNGFGGLAEIFDITKPTYHKEHKELIEMLSAEELENARASTLNAHYTSKEIITTVYKGLENLGFTGGKILEPSMGIGNFYSHLPESMQDSNLYGVELDSITGRIASQLYQNADIQVKGYQKTNFDKNQFDVAIGNVPFGDVKPFDKIDNKQGFLIHDYFFAKTLEKVRPGGIVAFVTSKGTLDKKDFTARKFMAERADLIGAIRLPDSAFKEVANTQVTADIIFLQKRATISVENPSWLEVAPNSDGLLVNKYFLDNPHMMLGEMEHDDRFGYSSSYTKCVNNDPNFNLELALNNAVKNITGEIPKYIHKDIEIKNITQDMVNKVNNFSFGVIDEQLFYRENDLLHEVKATGKTFERIEGLIAIKKATRDVINVQVNGCSDEVLVNHQKTLNKTYDNFVSKFGFISDSANSKHFGKDNDYPLLCALEKQIEVDGEKSYKKEKVFTERTIKQTLNITSVGTPSEALSVSMNVKGYVDIHYMSELCGNDKAAIVEDLLGQIFHNPLKNNENDIFEGYEPRDEYLSGNVREKLKIAQIYAKDNPDKYSINVRSLKEIQPRDLEASNIDVKISTPWITNEDYEKFIYELLDTPNYYKGDTGRNDAIKVNYNKFTSAYSITNKSAHDSLKVDSTYGTGRKNAYSIIEDTLNKKDVEVKDRIEESDGTVRYVLNKEATVEAKNRQELIRNKFKAWIFEEKTRRDKYVKYYNETFNNTVLRSYDGSHLTFPGMTPEIKLKPHQVNAVARTLYSEGNTLLAHGVGAGKTFEMIASAMEQKRIGLLNKAMFVVPNHLTGQFGADFLKLYPQANVLVTTKKDFEAKNRQQFVSRIATGNYDAVVIGHSQFERIPVSTERQELMLQQQIENIINGIAEAKKERGSNWSIKQLEGQKAKLENTLEKLLDSPKDKILTFEELGVDALYVDEAHEYKNCTLYTKMRGIAGISTNSAKKSVDMLMKTQYINEINGGRGVVFATGTPVSNSLVELFVMQRYLQSQKLEELGLTHLDNWISQFAEVTTAMELAPEGTGFQIKNRLSKYTNIPELMTFFKEVADIKPKESLGLVLPRHKEYVFESEPSEFINLKMKELVVRAKAIRSRQVDPRVDCMLDITGEARSMSLDPRLLDPTLADYEGSKIQKVIEQVYKEYLGSTDTKGTQIIFSDLGTPGNKGRFSVYDYIKSQLIEKGVPENEICFIHDAKDDKQREELFRDLRTGNKRIIIGSTLKMGTGTNIQDKLVALHHLDVPWRPADMEQREGRILRQGNTNSEVSIYKYVTKGTFDSYNWQLLEKKQEFISQIMTDEDVVLRIADDLNNETYSYAEIKAVATGDPRIKEKMEVDFNVSRLVILQNGYRNTLYHLEDLIKDILPKEIDKTSSQVDCLKKDILLAKESKNEDFEIKIDGLKIQDKDGAGMLILNKLKLLQRNEHLRIGEYRGFELSISRTEYQTLYIHLKGSGEYKIEPGDSALGLMTRFDNKLTSFESLLVKQQAELDELTKNLDVARVEITEPFQHEAELNELLARQSVLNSELELDVDDDIIYDETELVIEETVKVTEIIEEIAM